MFRRFLILTFIPFLLFASDHDRVEVLSDLFQTPSGVVSDCVNVITGHYFLTETDIYVPGPTPITYQRFYNSGNQGRGSLCPGWDDNYCIHANLYKDPKKNKVGTTIYEGIGGLYYRGDVCNKFAELEYCGNHLKWGVTNGTRGVESARCNIMNREVEVIDGKNPELKVKTENGEVWIFDPSFDNLYGDPDVKVSASFNLSKKINDDQTYLQYQRNMVGSLKSVSFHNSDDHQHASISFDRKLDNKKNLTQIDVSLNDGRKLELGYYKGLYLAKKPSAPHIAYEYKWKNGYITKRYMPGNRYTSIQYYDYLKKQDVGKRKVGINHGDDRRIGRVAALRAPVGPDSSPITTHCFYYELKDFRKEYWEPVGGYTEVRDAYNNKIEYHYNDHQRLTSVKEYLGEDKVYRNEIFSWKSKNGNLISKIKSDEKRRLSKLYKQSFDKNGNLSRVTLGGNLTGLRTELPCCIFVNISKPKKSCETHSIKYKYNDNNLVIEKDDGRQIVQLSYIGDSSKVASQFISDETGIKERTFFSYEPSGAVVEEIHDDGYTSRVDDLSGVTQRLITRTQNTQTIPVGLPEVIEEFYLDLKTGEEILIKKTVNKYRREGFLTKRSVYDNQGKLAYTQEWKHNGYGNPLWEKDPLGRIITRAFDSNGNITKETTPTQTTHFLHDYSDRLVKKTYESPCTLTETFTYDYKHNMTSSTDKYGNTTYYEYDPFDRLVKKILPPNTEGISAVEEYSYDTEDRLTHFTDANGNSTIKKYTFWDQPYYVEHPDGTVERYIYELDGTLAEHIDQKSTVTKFTHDYKKRKTSEEVYSNEGELLATHQWIYNSYQLLQEIDPEGIVTDYSYDGAGRLISVSCGDRETLYRYDSLGRQSETWEKTTKGQYRVSIKIFDALDQVIEERIENQDGQIFAQWFNTYDFDGNLVQRSRVTDNGLSTAKKLYNAIGQVTFYIDPNGNETHYNYTYESIPTTTEVDALGRQTKRTFDAQENLITEEKCDALGQTLHKTHFHYDFVGNLLLQEEDIYVSHVHERTISTAFAYDPLNRQTFIFEPEGKTTETTYTSTGKVSCIHKPDSKTIVHHYDALDRLEELVSSDQSVHYRYSYDLNDNVISVYDLVNQTLIERSFNEHGDLLSERFNGGHVMGYQYDSLGRLTEQILPDETAIFYHYDAEHLLSVERNGKLHQYHYDLSGKIKETHSLFGDKQTFTYDLSGAPLTQKSKYLSQTCTYDPLGNLVSMDHSDPLGDVSCQYTYDSLNQLTSETGFIDNHYISDSISNRRSKNGSHYQVNDLNQLVQLDDQVFTYDLNGNLEDFESEVTCTYDALDRLVEVNKGELSYRYIYDAFHRRLSRQVVQSGNEISFQQYLYSNDREIGVLEEDTISQLRVLGTGIGDVGAAVLYELAGKQYVPVHDLCGNVSVLVDEDGHVDVNRYTAFGEELSESKVSPWRFSSKRVDEETGWSYFGRRYYDASWGRWTTADPAWYADGPNLYAYVHNNPHRYCDPDGLSAVDQHQNDQLHNTHQTHGTFFGGTFRGVLDDTSWGLSNMVLDEYVCDNWQSRLGYGIGTCASLAVGLAYGGTEAKIIKSVASGFGKCATKIAKYTNFFAKEVKQVVKAEGTTLKVVEHAASQFEKKTVQNTTKGGSRILAKNSVEIYEKNINHIFRDAPGHFKNNTKVNREMLIETASNSKNFLGKDRFGNEWHSQIIKDGRQVWTSSRNGKIRNGGVNESPRNFDLKQVK